MLVTIGIPVVDQLIEHADFQTEPDPVLQTSSETLLYRLTGDHHGNIRPGLRWAFGAEPHTGKVFMSCRTVSMVRQLDDRPLAADTVHYGLRISQSPILRDPDQGEDQALAELRKLAKSSRRSTRRPSPATTDSSGPSSSNAGYGDASLLVRKDEQPPATVREQAFRQS